MGVQSSRERMLAALSRQRPDSIPCCFMIYQALRQACQDDFEFFDRQLELGVDTRVELPDLPFRFDPEVSIRTWKELPVEGGPPLLHREYETPSGSLRTVVRQTPDWPHGDAVPLFDDYVAPRAQEFLVSTPHDLPALRHLLVRPTADDIRDFHEQAQRYRTYAADKGLLLSGGWRDYHDNAVAIFGTQAGGLVGIDALMWLSGAVAPLEWAYDRPAFLEELVDIVAQWARARLEVILDVGVDLIIKRAWYEGTELWSPKLFQQHIAPVLRRDIAAVHAAGPKFGYVNTSGTRHIFGQLLDLGIDVLIGVDPVQGQGTDLALFAQQAAGRMCLWGGVSAPMTVEPAATPDAIWRAVEQAIAVCGPAGGFILSPVDNLMDVSPAAERNVVEFVRAWQHFRSL